MRDGAHKLFARNLRRASTEAERTLWRHLRYKQIAGFRFRRQCSIGPYIADFVCLEARLVVEVDGSQHGQSQDENRDDMLAEFGFRIVRFWNNDVLAKTDEVLASIHQALASTSPHPAFGHLPPQAGEGDQKRALHVGEGKQAFAATSPHPAFGHLPPQAGEGKKNAAS